MLKQTSKLQATCNLDWFEGINNNKVKLQLNHIHDDQDCKESDTGKPSCKQRDSTIDV